MSARAWYEVAADKATCDELLRAIRAWCTCEYNEADALVRQCPSHAALIKDTSWASRLIFERHEAARLIAEEWCHTELVQPVEPERTAPTTGLCQCGHWDSLHYGSHDRRMGCFAPALWPGQLLCRCSGFSTAPSQPRPASDGLVWENYGNGSAWLRPAA